MSEQLAFLSQNEKGGVIFGNTAGKTVNAFSFDKDLPLEMGTRYTVELEEKISKTGKAYNLIKSIKDLSGKELMPPKKPYFKQKADMYSEGMDKGNYRSCLTAYITACIQQKIQPDVAKFNVFLRQGEKDMFQAEPLPAVNKTAIQHSPVTSVPVNEEDVPF